MMSSPDLRRVIHGVDFSGANDAGKKIWIARGIIEEDILLITECFQAEDLPGSGRDRESSLTALKEFISEQKIAYSAWIFLLEYPMPW